MIRAGREKRSATKKRKEQKRKRLTGQGSSCVAEHLVGVGEGENGEDDAASERELSEGRKRRERRKRTIPSRGEPWRISLDSPRCQ